MYKKNKKTLPKSLFSSKNGDKILLRTAVYASSIRKLSCVWLPDMKNSNKDYRNTKTVHSCAYEWEKLQHAI